MIEKLDPNDAQDNRNIFILRKLNELIDAHNNHVHFARELQFQTELPSHYEIVEEEKEEKDEDDPADSFA